VETPKGENPKGENPKTAKRRFGRNPKKTGRKRNMAFTVDYSPGTLFGNWVVEEEYSESSVEASCVVCGTRKAVPKASLRQARNKDSKCCRSCPPEIQRKVRMKMKDKKIRDPRPHNLNPLDSLAFCQKWGQS
jgi:hypothetical protein